MSNELYEIFLSDNTRSQVRAFLHMPANALLISDVTGSGKSILARYIASALLQISPGKLSGHPHLLMIDRPDNKAEIPIESVRGLIKKMDLRVASGSNMPINRVAIIEDAHYLSTEAQNALLKLLEEPPAKSLIILTSSADERLLPTVASRAQKIYVSPPALEQALEFFKEYPKLEIESAYRLSRGAGSLLESLLSSQNDHALKVGVNQAKTYLAEDTYSRLIQVQQISKDRQAFAVFLDAMSRVLAVLNEGNINKNRLQASDKILLTRKAVSQAAGGLGDNANPRLIALSLVQNTKI